MLHIINNPKRPNSQHFQIGPVLTLHWNKSLAWNKKCCGVILIGTIHFWYKYNYMNMIMNISALISEIRSKYCVMSWPFYLDLGIISPCGTHTWGHWPVLLSDQCETEADQHNKYWRTTFYRWGFTTAQTIFPQHWNSVERFGVAGRVFKCSA